MIALRDRTFECSLQGQHVLLGLRPSPSGSALVRTLTEVGHRATVALDGYHLLSLLTERGPAPSLVIVDIEMPGSPGMRILDEIRALDPSIPLFLIVESNEPEIARRAFERGADRVFEQPYCVDDIRAAANTLLLTWRSERGGQP